MKAENYSHSTQSVSDLFIEAKIIIIFSFYLSHTAWIAFETTKRKAISTDTLQAY